VVSAALLGASGVVGVMRDSQVIGLGSACGISTSIQILRATAPSVDPIVSDRTG
jgi:hypothetical protein